MSETAATRLDPESWVDRYGDLLFRYAYSRLRDAEAAEEVVQETFLAAMKAIDQFRGEGSEQAWLMTILRRKIVDHIRKRRRESARGGEWEGDPAETFFDRSGNWRVDPRLGKNRPDAGMRQREFWAVLRECLSALSQRQADAFTLRELEELSSEEICETLGITSSNLWVLLHRARLQLMRCLKGHWLD
ncbi:MAG: sigma-70 family RNA polymerase sigma factor [Planctomycetota bacterium]|nr:MAG: sigma-70 family RNA polymerase sigma factor [Planctomycetota bacterium]